MRIKHTAFVEPPSVANIHGPGDKGTADPFRAFKLLARDDGRPYKSAEPVMVCLLVVVAAAMRALMITKA